MKKFIYIILIIFVFANISAQDIKFAEFLFNEKDYFRCITELKKIFYMDSIVDTAKIYNLIGVNYIKMNNYNNALIYFEKAKDYNENAYNNYYLTLFLQENFNKILEGSNLKTDKAKNIYFLANLFLDKLSKKDIKTDNKELKEITQNYFLIKKKNAFLAGALSALLPSTSMGRFYVERTSDAVFSITTMIIPALVTFYYYKNNNDLFMYISAGLFGLFYLGDIYGAANSAHIYFPSKKRAYYEKIISISKYSIFNTEYSF